MRTILGWLDTLPDALARSRPKLSIAKAWALFEPYTDRADEIEALV